MKRSIIAFLLAISFFSFFSIRGWACPHSSPVYPIIPICSPGCAPVTGFAQALFKYSNLSDVTVTPLSQENYRQCNGNTGVIKTTAEGTYGFCYPVGQDLTLMFKHKGYVTSQSATFNIGSNGEQLVGLYNNVSYQAMGPKLLHAAQWVAAHSLFSPPAWAHIDNKKCQLLITVTGYEKTLYDAPQGEKGVKVSLERMENGKAVSGNGYYDKVYYFRELFGKPVPIGGLSQTSKDGGVMFFNVEPGFYKVVGHKKGTNFRPLTFTCDPEWWKEHAPGQQMFINLSPPQGLQVVY